MNEDKAQFRVQMLLHEAWTDGNPFTTLSAATERMKALGAANPNSSFRVVRVVAVCGIGPRATLDMNESPAFTRKPHAALCGCAECDTRPASAGRYE